jgi:hypothetical protein
VILRLFSFSAALQVLTAPETAHYLVKGRNFTVAYHVLNVGGEPAYAVKLSDDWPADTFKHIEGTSSRTWEKIAPYVVMYGSIHACMLALHALVIAVVAMKQ